MARNFRRRTGRFNRRRRSVRFRKPSRLRFARDKVRLRRPMRRFARHLNAFAEKKMVTAQQFNGDSINTSGLVLGILAINQGTGRGFRVGNKVFVRYLTINAVINQNNTGVALIRTAAVWPKRPDTAIGDYPTTNFTQNFDLDKFIVLWDCRLGENNLG